jgi:hypothetical protein
MANDTVPVPQGALFAPEATPTSPTAAPDSGMIPVPQGALFAPEASIHAAQPEPPTPAVHLTRPQGMIGPQTAIGAPLTPDQSQEVSGVSDILHGNIRQGAGKIWDSERPHVIPGSPVERVIQKFNPDFHGAATPEYIAANEPAINKPLVQTSQFIDKKKHPVQKAFAEASEGMTSPGNIAILMSTGGLGLVENPVALGMANKLLSAGFAANSIGTLYKHSKSFAEAYDNDDWTEAAYQMTHALASGTISALAATHAVGGPETVAAKTTELAGKTADVVKAAATPIDTLANYIAKSNEEFGVPLSRGQAGGNISGAVESGLKKIPIINRPFAKLGTAQAEALNAAADKIISPTVDVTKLSPAERGERIQDQLDIAKSQAGSGYETALTNLTKTGAAVYELDPTNLQTTAKTLIDSLSPAEGFEEGLGSPGRFRVIRILQDIVDNDQGLTVGDAIKLRGQIREEIRNPLGDMKPYQAVLSKMNNALTDELTRTITESAVQEGGGQGNPESDAAGMQFLAASQRYAEVSEALRNKVVKSLRNSDPQAVGAMLVNRISPEVTDALKTLSPKVLVSVGDGLLQTMFDKIQAKNGGVLTGEGLGKLWDGIDPKVRSAVFGPELPKIQRFVDLVKKLDLQKSKTGWSGSKIATGAATGTAVGIETGMALAAHTIPPFSALAAGAGFGGYELSKILTGNGGKAFVDTLNAAADDTNPDQDAASDKLQKMAKPVNPYKTPFVKNRQSGVLKVGGPDNYSEGLPKVQR